MGGYNLVGFDLKFDFTDGVPACFRSQPLSPHNRLRMCNARRSSQIRRTNV